MKKRNSSKMENQSLPELQKENPATRTKRVAGKLGIVLCGALLVAQTGCILPGMRGGPPGLPGLPLPPLPRAEQPNPSGAPVVTAAGEGLGLNDSPELVESENSVNGRTAEGESHE